MTGFTWLGPNSLAEGAGYRIQNLPRQPYQTKYPPLYSWLLSWIWKASPDFPSNLPLAALFAWALLPAFLGLCWIFFKDIGFQYSHRLALCVAAAYCTYIVLLSVLLLSDLLFACLLLSCLILAERAATPESGLWLVAAAGLVAGLAYLTKRSAIPLLFSAPLCFWIGGQYKRALVFAAAMTPSMGLWTLWLRAGAQGDSRPVYPQRRASCVVADAVGCGGRRVHLRDGAAGQALHTSAVRDVRLRIHGDAAGVAV